MKVFQRALQYNDPEKVHLALLGMYERTEQHKLADELLDKMIKKFKHSCQVILLCDMSLNHFLSFIKISSYIILYGILEGYKGS